MQNLDQFTMRTHIIDAFKGTDSDGNGFVDKVPSDRNANASLLCSDFPLF